MNIRRSYHLWRDVMNFQSQKCLIRLSFKQRCVLSCPLSCPFPPLKIQQGGTIEYFPLFHDHLAQWKKTIPLVKEQWSDIIEKMREWWFTQILKAIMTSIIPSYSPGFQKRKVSPSPKRRRWVLSSPTFPEEVDPWRCEMLTCGYWQALMEWGNESKEYPCIASFSQTSLEMCTSQNRCMHRHIYTLCPLWLSISYVHIKYIAMHIGISPQNWCVTQAAGPTLKGGFSNRGII